MAYTKIINKTYDLADEIKNSELYQEMKKLDKIIKTKYKNELQEYQKTFLLFDEVFSTGGVYHPDFKEVSSKYKTAKETLFIKEEVRKYFACEQKLNEVLKEISDEIKNTVSSYNDFKGGYCHAYK